MKEPHIILLDPLSTLKAPPEAAGERQPEASLLEEDAQGAELLKDHETEELKGFPKAPSKGSIRFRWGSLKGPIRDL